MFSKPTIIMFSTLPVFRELFSVSVFPCYGFSMYVWIYGCISMDCLCLNGLFLSLWVFLYGCMRVFMSCFCMYCLFMCFWMCVYGYIGVRMFFMYLWVVYVFMDVYGWISGCKYGLFMKIWMFTFPSTSRGAKL